MDSIFDSVTSGLVIKSLDYASMNHSVIANNIANVNTVGYQKINISFDKIFGDVQQLVNNFSVNDVANNASIKSSLSTLSLQDGIDVEEAGVKVLLDKEMTALAKNTLHYQTVLTAYGKLGSLTSMAISGGRS